MGKLDKNKSNFKSNFKKHMDEAHNWIKSTNELISQTDKQVEYEQQAQFRKKVKTAKENLDLVGYYINIMNVVLGRSDKYILLNNKNAIIDSINNLEFVIADLKEFAEGLKED